MVEREKRYRKNRRAKGATQVAVWLSADEHADLETLVEKWECTKSEAIRNAISLSRHERLTAHAAEGPIHMSVVVDRA